MNYNADVFIRLYPVLNEFAYHYVAYKEVYSAIAEMGLNNEFWVWTCDGHNKVAIISWCMIFGCDTNNQIHWKKLEPTDEYMYDSGFRSFVMKELKLTKKQLWKYSSTIIEFRNKFIAHREIKFDKPVPNLDLAVQIAEKFDLWVRDMIFPDSLDAPYIHSIMDNYRTDIQSMMKKQVM